MRIAEIKSAYNSLIHVPIGIQCDSKIGNHGLRIYIGSPMLGVVGFGIVEYEIYFIYYSDILSIQKQHLKMITMDIYPAHYWAYKSLQI